MGLVEGASDRARLMHGDMNRYEALGYDEDLRDSPASFTAIRSNRQSCLVVEFHGNLFGPRRAGRRTPTRAEALRQAAL